MRDYHYLCDYHLNVTLRSTAHASEVHEKIIKTLHFTFECEMETAYRRTVNCVFHLSPEERNHLFELMLREYGYVESYFEMCCMCNIKRSTCRGDGDIQFIYCNTCRNNAVCMGCLERCEPDRWESISDGDMRYACRYCKDPTLKDISLRCIKFK